MSEDDYIGYLAQTTIAGVLPVTLAAKLRRSHFLFLGYGADGLEPARLPPPRLARRAGELPLVGGAARPGRARAASSGACAASTCSTHPATSTCARSPTGSRKDCPGERRADGRGAAPARKPVQGPVRRSASRTLDALLFFGRERETEIVTANVLAARLTVLYGPSGVGKTSLLRAGVVHRLRELSAQSPLAVAVGVVLGRRSARGDRGRRARGGRRRRASRRRRRRRAASPTGSAPGATSSAASSASSSTSSRSTSSTTATTGGSGRRAARARDPARPARERPARDPRGRAGAARRLQAARSRRCSRTRCGSTTSTAMPRAAAIVGPLARYNELAPPAERVDLEPELVEAVLDRRGGSARRAGAGGPSVDARAGRGRPRRGAVPAARDAAALGGGAGGRVGHAPARDAGVARRREADRRATTSSARSGSSPPASATPRRRCSTTSSRRPARRSRSGSATSPATRTRPRRPCAASSPGWSAPGCCGRWSRRATAPRPRPATRSSTTSSPTPCSPGARGTRRSARSSGSAARLGDATVAPGRARRIALVGLARTAALAVYAFSQRAEADQQGQRAQRRERVRAESLGSLGVDPEGSAALAIRAAETANRSVETERALRLALMQMRARNDPSAATVRSAPWQLSGDGALHPVVRDG